MKAALPLLALLFALPACASAQANPDSIHRRNDCRLAAQVLSTGDPRPRLQWAAEAIVDCPQAGRTIANAIGRHRTSADTIFLNWITLPANSLQDGDVFEAAMSVLQDRTATPEARVYANRLLYWLFYPSSGVYYGTLVDVDGDGRNPCVAFGASSHIVLVHGSPLPASWRAQVHAVTQRVLQDPTEPDPVRQSAACVALRSRSGN